MSNTDQGLLSHIGFRSATALVVANVIGAGVFTTTGFQAADLGNPTIILLLWLLGGVLAYCGALCFAELDAFTRGRAGGRRGISVRKGHTARGQLIEVRRRDFALRVIGLEITVTKVIGKDKYDVRFGGIRGTI